MSKGLIFDKFLRCYVREHEHVLLLEGFHQLEGDDMARPDSDGDVLEATGRVQHMQGPSVRVTIPHDVDAKVAARLLKKIAEWFEINPDLLADARPYLVTKPLGNEARMAGHADEVRLEEDPRKIIQDPQGVPSDDFDDNLPF